MKRKSLIIQVFVLLFLLPIVSSFAQDKKKNKKEIRAEQFKDVVKLVESRQFQFVADRAFPQGFRPMDLTTNPNFTKVNDSIAHGSMPFFGRGYTVAYGEGGGIKYEGIMEEVKFTTNEKKLWIRIEYRVRGKQDVYRVSIEVGYSGHATMNVNSNNRSSISYQGEVTPLPKEEEKE